MNKLHNRGKNQEQTTAEFRSADHEKQFARLIAAEIASNLQVNLNNRDVVVNLLTSTLERQLCNRDGLLEQYLHTQLDIIANTIRTQFDIDKEVDVNYSYATHAKLNDLLKYIKNSSSLSEKQVSKKVSETNGDYGLKGDFTNSKKPSSEKLEKVKL